MGDAGEPHAGGPGAGDRCRSDPAAPLLADADAEAALSELGRSQVELLPASAVQELRSLYDELHPEPGFGFDTDFSHPAPAQKRYLDARIREIVGPFMDAVFVEPAMFNVTFVVKWPGGGSEVPVHQDWSYVDESEHRSATVWIPLEDSSPGHDNGPLGVIPRTHLLPVWPRGANTIPWYLHHRDELSRHLEYHELRGGEALVVDSRVLHGSPVNSSTVPRRAVALMVTRRGTQLRYHHRAGDRMRVYAIDDLFFADHAPCDLRSQAFAGSDHDHDLLDDRPSVGAVPPRAELGQLGIDLSDAPLPAPEHIHLRGTPLGPSLPPDDASGRAARWHRRSVRRDGRAVLDRATGTLADWPGDPTLADSVGAALDEIPGTIDLAVRIGRCRAAHLRDVPDLAARLPAGTDRDDTWVLWFGADTELTPRRLGTRRAALDVVALAGGRLPGRLVLQVGTTLVPLDDGRTVRFDPTTEHLMWNADASPVAVLVRPVRRDRPPWWPARGAFDATMARQIAGGRRSAAASPG